MEYQIVKEISVQHDDNFRVSITTGNKLNYTQKVVYVDSFLILENLLYNTFFNYIDYVLSKVNDDEYNLIIDNKYTINIKNNKNGIMFDLFPFRYFLQYNNNTSNSKILTNVFDLINQHLNSILEKSTKQKILNKIPQHYNFNWYYNEEETKFVLNHTQLNINILCEFIDSKIQFISYLHHEGEIYNNGSEYMTNQEIINEINYYTNLLSHQQNIIEELENIKL